MGKVIGRSGNTAKAIRTLLRVVGMKHNARVNLKINEPVGGSRAGTWDGGSPSGSSAVAPESSQMKSVDEAMEDLRL
jgi:hypothetical protein